MLGTSVFRRTPTSVLVCAASRVQWNNTVKIFSLLRSILWGNQNISEQKVNSILRFLFKMFSPMYSEFVWRFIARGGGDIIYISRNVSLLYTSVFVMGTTTKWALLWEIR
jgi:hypothetical protein